MPQPRWLEPRRARDVLEGAVAAVAVENGCRVVTGLVPRQRRALGEDDVQPAVVVEVERADAAALGLEDVVLAIRLAADVDEGCRPDAAVTSVKRGTPRVGASAGGASAGSIASAKASRLATPGIRTRRWSMPRSYRRSPRDLCHGTRGAPDVTQSTLETGAAGEPAGVAVSTIDAPAVLATARGGRRAQVTERSRFADRSQPPLLVERCLHLQLANSSGGAS